MRVGGTSWPRKLVAYLGLSLAGLVALFPIYWTASTSLKQRVDTLASPPKFFDFEPTLSNYRHVLSDHEFIVGLTATVEITLLSTMLCTLAGALAAYALARHPRFVGRRPLEATVIVVRALPAIVLAVPLYSLAIDYGFYDNRLALAVAYAALNLPFSVWLMVSFIRQIPVELEEAARVDGAAQWTVLTRIVTPLALPGLAATTIFVALLSWNEFLLPLVLSDQNAKTLPVYVAGFVTSRSIDWGPLAAASMTTILPIAILTIVVQRRLVSGLSLGAVKE